MPAPPICWKTPSDGGDAEYFVEAGGAAGLIQSCGVEHGRAFGLYVGQHVAAGIGRSAHRLFGRAGAGQRDRVAEVDSDLEHVGLGVEDRGEASDQLFGGEKPPALTQMQPVASVDVFAQLGVRGAVGELEEPVSLLQYRPILARQADIEHTGNVRPVPRRCSSAETSSASVR